MTHSSRPARRSRHIRALAFTVLFASLGSGVAWAQTGAELGAGVSTASEPLPGSTDVIEPITGSADATPGPVDDTLETIVDPIGEATEPIVEPIQEVVDPVLEPIEDGIQPVVEPVEDAVSPIDGTAEPTAEDAAPSGDTAVPAADPAPLSDDPAEPSVGPATGVASPTGTTTGESPVVGNLAVSPVETHGDRTALPRSLSVAPDPLSWPASWSVLGVSAPSPTLWDTIRRALFAELPSRVIEVVRSVILVFESVIDALAGSLDEVALPSALAAASGFGIARWFRVRPLGEPG